MPTGTDKRATPEGGRRYLGTVPGTLLETLGIVVTVAEPDRVEATMPVTPAHHQPHGILHGGASVALAETVASIGAGVGLEAGQRAVGLEINANHIRQVASGTVHAVGTPLHRGRRTHVWQVEIRDGAGRLVCVSRCTVAVIFD
jgi:1,4-dihydroxy-2-naphthoyl-CoA hydrolase